MRAQPEWDSSHTEFQRECLADLEAALGRLGVRLVTRRGEAVAMQQDPVRRWLRRSGSTPSEGPAENPQRLLPFVSAEESGEASSSPAEMP